MAQSCLRVPRHFLPLRPRRFHPLVVLWRHRRRFQNGILVKGSNYLEALTQVDTIVFDKTGTLTKGVFDVQHIETAQGLTKDEVLSMAAAAESRSTHPVAHSIVKAYGNPFQIRLLRRMKKFSGKASRQRYTVTSCFVAMKSS